MVASPQRVIPGEIADETPSPCLQRSPGNFSCRRHRFPGLHGGRAGCGRRLLPRQNRSAHHSEQCRRLSRTLRPPGERSPRPPHPGESERHPGDDAGGRRRPVGGVHRQCRPERRHRDRADPAADAARSDDAERALRPEGAAMDRIAQRTARRRRGLAYRPRHHARRRQAGRAQHGIDRRRLRQLPDSEACQCGPRHEIQVGDRLSGRRRHQSGDRARRDRWPLQLLDRLDHGEAGLDSRQEAGLPVPHRAAGARHAGAAAGFRRSR